MIKFSLSVRLVCAGLTYFVKIGSVHICSSLEHISVIRGDQKMKIKGPVENFVFNPIIMAPPSDYSTIYTTLKSLAKVDFINISLLLCSKEPSLCGGYFD